MNDATELYFLHPALISEAESTSIELLFAAYANVNNVNKPIASSSGHTFLNLSPSRKRIYSVGSESFSPAH